MNTNIRSLLVLAVMAMSWLAAPVHAAAPERTPFDHLTTGFELIGKHRDLPCESCHVNAVFKGTPRYCAACHGQGTAVRATAKPVNHVRATDRCEACHTPVAFNPAVLFDHAEALGSCSTCHGDTAQVNGADHKGPTHIETNLECNLCHSTIGWGGAMFTHAGVTGGCAGCHDSVKATGRPATHIPLLTADGSPCEDCHSTTNFTTFAGTAMNHMSSAVAGMPCQTCHEAGMSWFGAPPIVTRPATVNGAPHPASGDCGQCHLDTISFKNGSGMPPDHIPTTQTCTLCHSNPADYSVYVMNHQGITNNCAQCHGPGKSFANMAPPTLKLPPADHVPFGTAACEACHSATNFTTFMFTNASGAAPPAMVHSAVASAACDSCHAMGLTFVGAPPTKTTPANHIPFGTAACTACHTAGNFTSFVIANTSPPMNHAVVTSIVCSTCHEAGKTDVGAVPYPTITRPALEASGATHPTSGECSDCHTTVSFKGATNYPSTHIPLTAGTSANCSACHTDANDFKIYTMDHSLVSNVCTTCHAVGRSFANMAPPTLKQPPADHVPFGSADCKACHAPTNFTTFQITNASGTTPPAMVHSAVASMTCATCHARGLTFVGAPTTKVEPSNHIPIGTAACQNCHSATDFSTFLIPNAVPPMNHTGFNTGCVNCHGSGKTDVGVAPKATVTLPPTHIPTGSIACEGCHSSSSFASFAIPNSSGSAAPSMVHSVVTSIVCSTCHEAGKTDIGTSPKVTVVRPALKADGTAHVPGGECSTCHFSTTSFKGASDLPANHIPLPAADNNNCALCHSNPGNYSIGTMNHVNISNNCAQCHATGKSFANMAPPTLKVPPSNHVPFGTAACEACHSPSNFTNFVIGNVVSNAPPGMVHSVVSSLTCASCHARGLTFVGTPAVKVEPSNHVAIGTQPCQQCHSPTNFTSFAFSNVSGTAPPSMVHSPGFTTNCIACHGAGLTFVGTPATKVLPANHIPTGTIRCEGCHSPTNFSTFVVTNASTTAPPGMVHSLVTATACSACHEAGKSFVGTPALKLRPALKADGSPHVATGECNGCHFNTTSFKGATDLPSNHIPLPAADTGKCTMCHTTGNYSQYVMNHANIINNCKQCHAYGLSFAGIAPPQLVAPPAGPTGHIPSNPPNGTANYACESCHSPTVFTTFAGTKMKHAVVTAMQCMACHEIGMQWKTNTGVRLWVRDGANHYKGQDCDGSGCHSARDKYAYRAGGKPNAAPALKASGVGVAGAAAGAALGKPGSVDHRRITGACVSCHDQASGIGRPDTHLAASTRCESCHTTISWLPVARVDHTQVTGSCVSCHGTGVARAKPNGHLASSDNCESCHTTVAWTPARVEHASLLSRDCQSCHDGVHTVGKPVNHVPTSAQCDTCHGVLAWKPAKLDHSTLTGNCVSCHNNAIALGMGPNHMTTQRDCAICHKYPDWAAVVFTHTSVGYPGAHRTALTCANCHTGNSDTIPWAAPADAGSCAGCHSSAFKAASHPKTADGQLYTAHELHDCAGSCHVYKDATLGEVATSKPGPYHRVTDAAFKH